VRPPSGEASQSPPSSASMRPPPRPRAVFADRRGLPPRGSRRTRRRARRGSGHFGETPENASPGRTSGISSRHRPSLAFFHFLSRETGGVSPRDSSKKLNRPRCCVAAAESSRLRGSSFDTRPRLPSESESSRAGAGAPEQPLPLVR